MMFESVNTKIYRLARAALEDIGNTNKVYKNLRRIIMILNDELNVMYSEGINVAPGDGEYKVYIDDMHILTKRIIGGRGKNFPAWVTKLPKSPWRAAIEKYEIPMLGFRVIYNSKDDATSLEYDDVKVVDLIKQAHGLPNTWVGKFLYKGQLKFMFRMVKSD